MWAVRWELCPDAEKVGSGREGSWLNASLTGCHSYLGCFPTRVARDGIEPPTRGFSVRCSTN